MYICCVRSRNNYHLNLSINLLIFHIICSSIYLPTINILHGWLNLLLLWQWFLRKIVLKCIWRHLVDPNLRL